MGYAFCRGPLTAAHSFGTCDSLHFWEQALFLLVPELVLGHVGFLAGLWDNHGSWEHKDIFGVQATIFPDFVFPCWKCSKNFGQRNVFVVLVSYFRLMFFLGLDLDLKTMHAKNVARIQLAQTLAFS